VSGLAFIHDFWCTVSSFCFDWLFLELGVDSASSCVKLAWSERIDVYVVAIVLDDAFLFCAHFFWVLPFLLTLGMPNTVFFILFVLFSCINHVNVISFSALNLNIF
jgi:hypothetical protein